VDRSNGPNRGTIYIVWAESPSGRGDADILLMKMPPPNGRFPDTSTPVIVNDDGPGADQFFPWLSVDPMSGDIEVLFYDRRDDLFGLLMNAYVARSTDGGVTFGRNQRVSSGSSDPRVQAAVLGSNANPIGIGDYIGIAALNGKAHMLWTDTSHGKQEIHYGQFEFRPSGGGGGGGPASDTCQSPKIIGSLPFSDAMDTRTAPLPSDDPVSG